MDPDAVQVAADAIKARRAEAGTLGVPTPAQTRWEHAHDGERCWPQPEHLTDQPNECVHGYRVVEVWE